MAGSSVERVVPLAVPRVAAGPVEELLERYRRYLVSERCLAQDTIRVPSCREFYRVYAISINVL